MQTLGLSDTGKKSDGRLKSLLWPTVDNAWDVDYLGQQGFWICLIVGLLSLAIILISVLPDYANHAAGLAAGTAMFFVYFVGGMGVREASFPAAVTVFVTYAINQIGSGHAPGVLSIIIGAVLLSNVRATFLASRWAPAKEDEDRPTRFNETLRDKLVDQVPPRAWPWMRIPFFIIASFLLIFTLYAIAVAARRPVSPATDENSTSSVVVSE
jgi:MFS family permease